MPRITGADMSAHLASCGQRKTILTTSTANVGAQ